MLPGMARMLVMDDEPQVVLALSRALEGLGHQVQAAATGEAGIVHASTWRPDLVVLDGQLPDLTALEVIHRLRPWCGAPILVLSERSDERRKVEALEAGADDYLQKPFGMPELLARLGALLRRSGPATADPVLRFPGLELDLAARTVRVADEETRLTPTEWRILEALATHPGKLVTHRWLLARAWDASYGDESRQALRAHVRSLRAKLGDDAFSPRYIRTESGVGYRWLPTGAGDQAPATPPEEPRGTGRDGEEVLHELNNVLTAMRLTAYMLKRQRGGAHGSDELAERCEGLVRRAATLAVALQQSAAPADL
jgi:two-component system KDP operon response regulator KdpE